MQDTICLLNDSFPPLIDGVANTVVNYAKNLPEEGLKSLVITPDHNDAEDQKFDYPVIRYPSIKTQMVEGYPAGVPFSPKIARATESENITLLHSHCPVVSTLVARELRQIRNVPIVMTYHTKFDIDIAHIVKKGIPTPAGKQNWQRATVESILRNEKYKGAALLQKSFTVDFLQKKMKVNEGEVPQYYVEHSHEAIVDPEEWERVQLELARRKNSPRRTHCNSPFAGKLICGDCGEIFGSKVWHSTSKYRRTIWQCNAKFKGEEKCRTPHLYEDDLKQHFITALSTLISDRDALLDDLRTIRAQWLDFQDIEQECEDLLQEMDVVSGMIKAVVNENASMEMSQAVYTDRNNALVDRFEKSQSRYDELQNLKERRQIQADEISGYLFALYELDLLELEFNDALWNTIIRHVVVYNDEHLIFHFKTGHEISVKI